jgi:hypothetical protein
MTRPDQKLSERQTLDAVFAALGLRPDKEPEAGETPDFTVLVSGRTLGVEITTYQLPISWCTPSDGKRVKT